MAIDTAMDTAIDTATDTATDLPERVPVPAGARPRPWASLSARRRERAQAAAVRADADRTQALEGVAACLERAAALLQDGWTQDRWYVVHRSGGRRAGAARVLSRPEPGTVVAVCLVGAVVQAAGRAAGAGSVARRTVDVLSEVLEQPGPAGLPGFRRVCSPPERAVRVHALVRWNDEPCRTRQQVLGLVEAARCRALAAAQG